jgi:hypothetical protein
MKTHREKILSKEKATLCGALVGIAIVILIALASWALTKIEYRLSKPKRDYVTKLSTGIVETSCNYAINNMIKKAKESNIVNGMLEISLEDYCSEFKASVKEIYDRYDYSPYLVLDIEKAPKSNRLAAIINTCCVDTHYIVHKLEENGIKVIAINDYIKNFYGIDR